MTPSFNEKGNKITHTVARAIAGRGEESDAAKSQ